VPSVCLFFHVVRRIVRADGSLDRTFAVVCWSHVVYRARRGFLAMANLLTHGRTGSFPVPPEAWSPTSVAQWLPRSSVGVNAYSAISKLDLVLPRWLALLAIGISRTSNQLPAPG
jgi:hypothetical protein